MTSSKCCQNHHHLSAHPKSHEDDGSAWIVNQSFHPPWPRRAAADPTGEEDCGRNGLMKYSIETLVQLTLRQLMDLMTLPIPRVLLQEVITPKRSRIATNHADVIRLKYQIAVPSRHCNLKKRLSCNKARMPRIIMQHRIQTALHPQESFPSLLYPELNPVVPILHPVVPSCRH